MRRHHNRYPRDIATGPRTLHSHIDPTTTTRWSASLRSAIGRDSNGFQIKFLKPDRPRGGLARPKPIGFGPGLLAQEANRAKGYQGLINYLR
jgi:hypothetical protein